MSRVGCLLQLNTHCPNWSVVALY